MTRNSPKRFIKQLSALLALAGLLFTLTPAAWAGEPYIGVDCSWNTTGQITQPAIGQEVISAPAVPCTTTAPLNSDLYDFSTSLLSFGLTTYEYDSQTDPQDPNIELRTYYLPDDTIAECKVWTDQSTYDVNKVCDYKLPTTTGSYKTALTVDCINEDYGEGDGSCRIAPEGSSLISGLDSPPTGNQLSVLDSFILGCYSETPNSFCDDLLGALQSSSGRNIVDGLIRSLLPLDPETAMDMSHSSQRGGASAIQQRLSRLRSGNLVASNIETRLYLANNQWLPAGSLLAANDTVGSDASPGNVSVDSTISEFGKLGLFVNASIIDGKYDAGSISGRSDAEAAILTVGVDYRFTSDLVAGVAFNLGQSKVEYMSSVSGKIEADNYDLIGYTSWYKDNWYVDGALTLGIDHYEQLRDPNAVNNSFETKYKGNRYDLSGTVGYEFVIDALNISPHIQVSAGQLTTDEYRERETNSGGGGAALVIDEQKRDTGTVSAGSYFRYVVTTSSGVFIPSLRLAAVYDYKTEAQQITGRFVNLANNSSSFQIDTEQTDANYFVVAAGMSFQLKNGNSGFFNVESLEGYDNLDQNRLTLGWRWEL